MNSSIINILEIFNAGKTLNSVGFSAGYNFDTVQTEIYFKELVSNSKSHTPIFAGIIIIETSDKDGNFTIIDGLQRVTTLSLLLCALCDGYKNTSQKNEDARRKIISRYLVNDENEVKLRLVGSEKEIYKKIVFSEKLNEEEQQSNLFQTYNEFLSMIKAREITAAKLFKVISKIQFMVVFADKLDIPARELYQSLNGNKTDLSQINLISSLIYQSDEDAGDLWQEIVNNYKKLGMAAVLNNFIRDFLSIQNNGKIPGETLLYKNFKTYFDTIAEYQSKKSIIENIYKYSEFYLKIIQSDFEDEEIKNQIEMINQNNGQDTYPYLMEVLDDLENSHINQDIFIDILNTLNSFILDRTGENSEDMKMNFASLSIELNKMLANRSLEQINSNENKLTINEINQLSTFGV